MLPGPRLGLRPIDPNVLPPAIRPSTPSGKHARRVSKGASRAEDHAYASDTAPVGRTGVDSARPTPSAADATASYADARFQMAIERSANLTAALRDAENEALRALEGAEGRGDLAAARARWEGIRTRVIAIATGLGSGGGRGEVAVPMKEGGAEGAGAGAAAVAAEAAIEAEEQIPEAEEEKNEDGAEEEVIYSDGEGPEEVGGVTEAETEAAAEAEAESPAAEAPLVGANEAAASPAPSPPPAPTPAKSRSQVPVLSPEAAPAPSPAARKGRRRLLPQNQAAIDTSPDRCDAPGRGGYATPGKGGRGRGAATPGKGTQRDLQEMLSTQEDWKYLS